MTEETKDTSLVVISKTNVMNVFTQDGKIDPILKKIADDARSIVADVTTARGRKEIASIAYKVAQSKTYLDGLGKDLVAEMKELPKKVDASRKSMRDFLDGLRDEVRKPLTDWEEEQVRIEEAKKAEQAAAALAIQIENDHEIALLMDREFDRKKEEERRKIEQERIRREQEIADAATAKAKKDAEAAAAAALAETERLEREARLAQERAERELAEAKIAAKEAEKRRVIEEAQAEARRAKEAEEAKAREVEAANRARLAEIARQDAERADIARKQKEQREADEAKAADVEHRKSVNNKALADLIAYVPLDDETAKAVIKQIAMGKISAVSIKY